MTLHVPVSEPRRGSRIDDLGTTHSSVSPEMGPFEDHDRPPSPLETRAGSAHLRIHRAMR
jgi:hypothetical protein